MQKLSLLHIFRFCTGSELFHKIALTNHKLRQMICNAAILNQKRVLYLCKPRDGSFVLPPRESFLYAMRVVTTLNVSLRHEEELTWLLLDQLETLLAENAGILPSRPIALEIIV